MGKLIDNIRRYSQKNSSSLAFWWLPVYEGSGHYEWTKECAGDYYVDFSAKANYKYLFDEKGVVLLDYKGKVGVQYNPCAIAQYGLGLYSCYLKDKNIELIAKMESQAEWLCNNVKEDRNGIGRLEYNFGMGDYAQNANEPYISAIAQGQAVSFLLRVGVLLNKKRYLEVAESIYKCFCFNITEGGVVNYDSEGRVYLEEAITEKISCILDGFIYAMFGVYDYYQYTHDAIAKQLFEACCKTIKTRIQEFDLGFWSRADCYLEKPKMPASKFYHNVHIQQLKALFVLTNEEVYEIYAEKWDRYQRNSFFCFVAFLYKCWFKIFYY